MSVDKFIGIIRESRTNPIQKSTLKQYPGWRGALTYAVKMGLVNETENSVELKETPLLAAVDGYFTAKEAMVLRDEISNGNPYIEAVENGI